MESTTTAICIQHEEQWLIGDHVLPVLVALPSGTHVLVYMYYVRNSPYFGLY